MSGMVMGRYDMLMSHAAQPFIIGVDADGRGRARIVRDAGG
jgi:hypothetical protein